MMDAQKLQKIKADLEQSRSKLWQLKSSLKSSKESSESFPQPTLNSSLEIISVHVPKTAGSFLHNVLQQVYGDSLFSDYQEQLHPALFQVLKTIPKAKSQLINFLITTNVKAIHGHFPIAKYEGYFPHAQRIVWLRNPVQRLISTYYFLLSEPSTWVADPLAKGIAEIGMDIYDFVELSAMQNQISNYYCRGRQLKDFDFIGIHEHFTEDLIQLKNLMKLPDFTWEIINDNKYPNYQDSVSTLMNDSKLIEKISLSNKEDIELYELALKLRETRRKS